MQGLKTIEDVEVFMLKHGENIVDSLGEQVDRIETILKSVMILNERLHVPHKSQSRRSLTTQSRIFKVFSIDYTRRDRMVSYSDFMFSSNIYPSKAIGEWGAGRWCMGGGWRGAGVTGGQRSNDKFSSCPANDSICKQPGAGLERGNPAREPCNMKVSAAREEQRQCRSQEEEECGGRQV
ncbi:Zinc transporter 9 [Chionoecetes opilio]|uniref:Zinc transporter 9 n=1 Tax=Chionoecetes opilio TaxID=41210 RepID=A0A8J4YFR7_CHIOP|nr:Zinc transporter 9 [Chionoecetes opilio]